LVTRSCLSSAQVAAENCIHCKICRSDNRNGVFKTAGVRKLNSLMYVYLHNLGLVFAMVNAGKEDKEVVIVERVLRNA